MGTKRTPIQTEHGVKCVLTLEPFRWAVRGDIVAWSPLHEAGDNDSLWLIQSSGTCMSFPSVRNIRYGNCGWSLPSAFKRPALHGHRSHGRRGLLIIGRRQTEIHCRNDKLNLAFLQSQLLAAKCFSFEAVMLIFPRLFRIKSNS